MDIFKLNRMKASKIFNDKNVKRDFEINLFAMPKTTVEDSIVFLENDSLINQVNNNKNISGVITDDKLSKKINKSKGLVIEKNPKTIFYEKYLESSLIEKIQKNKIHPSSIISPNAVIEDFNVEIGKGTIIEDNVVIKSNTKIGNYCKISSGCVIGGEGFEVKEIEGKRKVLPHNGKVIISDNVYVGFNTCIDKGIFGIDTIIKKDSKIDNLVNIAHCVQIGENCLITAGVTFAGSVKVGDNVFFGPNSIISNDINIGDGAQITIGSTVVSNVPKNKKVTGYFAIEHAKFIKEKIGLMKIK